MKFNWRKLFIPDKITNNFWRGALYGLEALVYLMGFLVGYFYNLGLPKVLLGLGSFLVTLIAYRILLAISIQVYRGIGKIAAPIIISILAILVTIYLIRSNGFSWPGSIFLESLAVAFAGQILIVGSVFSLIRGSGSKALMIILLLAGISMDAVGLNWLLSKGNNTIGPEFSPKPFPQLSLENPSVIGSNNINFFTYGSGTDKQRPEYGAEVRYKTQTVDASLILPEWTGTKAERREWFWGFGVKEFPLNGRVWMPEGDGPFPLFLIVHGNHGMEDFSDPGYEYIGELLASRGIIAVSVDENFVNATWSGDFRGREMQTRGWLLLKHLEVWQNWNDDANHDFHGKVNMDKIILAGHSRGGEAVVIAAAFNKLKYYPDNANLKFDFNFNLNGIIAIAPTDKRYLRRLELENINYLTLQGSFDSDEASYFGWRQARRISFTDSSFWFKAGVYVHRANHGQFNSTWGDRDFGIPGGLTLDIKALLTADEQMQVAKTYIATFCEVVFNGKNEYLPVFKNAQSIKDWLPQTIYINNYFDSNFELVENFEDDVDITSGMNGHINAENLAVWREEILQFRDDDIQGNNAVVLGWSEDSLDRQAFYEIELDSIIDVCNLKSFSISAGLGKKGDLKSKDKNKDETVENEENGEGENENENVVFSIQLIDSLGQKLTILSDYKKFLAPRLSIEFMKAKSLATGLGNEWEPTPEYFEYALEDFEGELKSFSGIHIIRFVFDQTPNGIIIIDDIGFYPKQAP